MRNGLIILGAVALVVMAGCSNQESPVVPAPGAEVTVATSLTPADDCFGLIAGKTMNAGSVCVRANAAAQVLEVTYSTANGWELAETHLWVGTSLAAMPQTKNGNPKVGHFRYGSGDITGETTWTAEVPLSRLGPQMVNGDGDLCGMTVYVAAHADLRRDTGHGWETEGAWCEGDRIADHGSWAMVATTVLGGDLCVGEAIVYTSDQESNSFDVWMMDADGANARRLTTTPEKETQPVIDRAGEHVAFIRWNGGSADIVMLDLRTNAESVVYSSDRMLNASLSFFPGDSEILFSRNDGGSGHSENYEVYAVDVFSGAARNITARAGNEASGDVGAGVVVFSRDMNGCCCSSCGELFALPIGGGAEVRLTNVSGGDGEARIFGDGEVAFTHHGSPVSVARVHADGTGYTVLHSGIYPSWSPDGERLVFVNDRQIWTMDADGTNAAPITTEAADYRDTYWARVTK